MQQHQRLAVEHCQHPVQLGFVRLEFVLELEHLAKRPEFVRPFWNSNERKKKNKQSSEPKIPRRIKEFDGHCIWTLTPCIQPVDSQRIVRRHSLACLARIDLGLGPMVLELLDRLVQVDTSSQPLADHRRFRMENRPGPMLGWQSMVHYSGLHSPFPMNILPAVHWFQNCVWQRSRVLPLLLLRNYSTTTTTTKRNCIKLVSHSHTCHSLFQNLIVLCTFLPRVLLIFFSSNGMSKRTPNKIFRMRRRGYVCTLHRDVKYNKVQNGG